MDKPNTKTIYGTDIKPFRIMNEDGDIFEWNYDTKEYVFVSSYETPTTDRGADE